AASVRSTAANPRALWRGRRLALRIEANGSAPVTLLRAPQRRGFRRGSLRARLLGTAPVALGQTNKSDDRWARAECDQRSRQGEDPFRAHLDDGVPAAQHELHAHLECDMESDGGPQ